jgi:hypothetical protein
MSLAYIRFIEPGDRPTDPGYGVPEGRPDNSLPGRPSRPSHPIAPPWGGGISIWPPSPVDPEWGVDAGERPTFPIYIPLHPDNSLPGQPGSPSQGLPPVAGHLPAPNPPPGTIWPPLPPGAPTGKAALLVWLSGVGYRYVVVEIPPPTAVQPIVPGAQPK